MRTRTFFAALALLLAAAQCASAGDRDDWQHYGGGPVGSQYSSLTQINRDNVGGLQLAWTYRTGDLERHPDRRPLAALNVTPILVPKAAGQSLVLCSAMNRVIALDPTTGKERWVYDPKIEMGPQGNKFLCRGVAYWEDTAATAGAICRHRIFTGTKDLRLIALDAVTGRLCAGFGAGGTVDIRPDIYTDTAKLNVGDVQFSAPPVTVADLVIIGGADNTKFWRADSPRGEVRAFDARTGALRWKFDPLPHDAPDPADVQKLARQFRDSKYELRPVIASILKSDAFRDPDNRGALVKSPTDLIVGTFRVIGTPPANPSLYPAVGRALGQDLLDPPNVKGWPGGLAWIDTSLLPARNAFMHGVAAGVDVQATGKQTLATQARRDMKNLPVTVIDPAKVKALNATPKDQLAELILPVSPAGGIAAPAGSGTLGTLLLDPTFPLK